MRSAAAIAVLVLLTACAGGDGSDRPAAAPSGEWIAFARERGRVSTLYAMRPDGTGTRRLAPRFSQGAWPAWSPDGTRLAFTSTRDHAGVDTLAAAELYVVGADGTGERRLTDDRIGEFRLAWTGVERLVFSTCWNEDEPRTCGLESLKPDGSERQRLVAAPAEAAMIYGAAVAPDGSRIAFATPRAGERWLAHDDRRFWWWENLDVYTVASDGSGKRRLTNDPGNDRWPVWSPDGSKILFASDRDRNGDCVYYECAGHASELYVMNADGSEQRRLTRTRAEEAYGAWSPDGTRIAFARTLEDDEDDFELYVMNADGTCETRLTNNEFEDKMPAWTGSGGGRLEC